MLSYIIEGFVLGLGLAILVGPLLIALTQTAIEQGARAGLLVALGIWISDILVITGSYLFIRELADLEADRNFVFWMGLIGGFILIVFGLGTMANSDRDVPVRQNITARHALGLISKGFLVNTINPFTFFFWISTISTYLIGRKADTSQTFAFLTAIMIMIMCTDSLKVFGAKMIRHKLQSAHLKKLNQIAGLLLVGFGLFLLFRVRQG